jgi:glutamate/tyrosine decarboxylase-like PLP-dependent enzyme
MTDTGKDLLQSAYTLARAYQDGIRDRRVFPSQDALDNLTQFDEPLPSKGTPQSAEETLRLLDEFGSPATVACTGGRYYGFVTGGALPVTVASNWLATTWDQNGALTATSPIVAKLESVALGWLCEVLGLPMSSKDCGGAFVTGATMANFTALAAARHTLLAKRGWDVNAKGLFGAPEIKVVVGDEVHTSILKALMLLGLGRERVTRVPVDNQGRMIADELPELDDMTIVCIQAGNVNSGAFDPAQEICEAAKSADAWVHADGAFGIWAMTTSTLDHLTTGYDLADSWAMDAHKWLNTPYDCGIAIVRQANHLSNAMSATASYLITGDDREPSHYGPEFSRRARGIDVWAALRTLGKQGVTNLIEQNCRQARMMANLLTDASFTVHNDVVINQVVVSFGTPENTLEVIRQVQADGTTWAGGTSWQGHTAMRLSISSWATTDEDIQRSAEAIVRIARQVKGKA